MANPVHQVSDYLEAFSLGISRRFDDDFKAHPKSFVKILATETIERMFDTEWMTTGLGAVPEKGMGEPITTSKILKSPTKQYGLRAWALGVVIEYEAFRWALFGTFKNLPSLLSRSMVDRYNTLGYSVFNNAFAAPSTVYQDFRGGNLVDVNKSRLDGGTWSNESTLNTGLSYLGIQEALVDMKKLVDERGIFVEVTPKTIICSVDLEWLARTLVESKYRADNANMNVNLVSGLDIHSSPYLSSTTAWFLSVAKGDLKLKMRMGDAPSLERDNDVRTRNLLMTLYASMELACFDAKGLWGSLGA